MPAGYTNDQRKGSRSPQHLSSDDARRVIRMLGDLIEYSGNARVKRRRLLAGLAQLVGADAWVWTQARGYPPDAKPMAFWFAGGGWPDGQQFAEWLQSTEDPEWDELCQIPLAQQLQSQNGRHLTRTRDQLTPDSIWYESRLYRTWYTALNLDHFMISLYPLGGDAASAIGFWRHRGRPNFTGRDRFVVHVVLSEIDWLHRAGSDVPAADHMTSLPMRLRRVLHLLVCGDSRKQVAAKLKISEHTVAEYSKSLHKHFGVNSRGELLAKFISGFDPAAR